MVDIIGGLRDASRMREVMTAVARQMANADSVMMMLGPYMFSVGTAAPQTMSHRASYSWASQDRVGQRPLLQWTGPGAERLTLNGRIYPQYKGGLSQIQLMREMAGIGWRWLLVDGMGKVYGLFAIREVEETGTLYDYYGAPRRIDFRLQLEYAGDDG